MIRVYVEIRADGSKYIRTHEVEGISATAYDLDIESMDDIEQVFLALSSAMK